MKYYSGIGSRETPQWALELMEDVGEALASKGYVLRSGGADGADSAFEKKCGELKEIFIPWNGFKQRMDSEEGVYSLTNNAHKGSCALTAKSKHPAWHACSPAVKKLYSCSVLQVLGQDLETPSEFVLCYAKRTKGGKAKGGTAMAISIAGDYNIPVFNLYDVNVYGDWDVQQVLDWIGV